MSFKVLFVPIGVPTFHMESANEQFNKSVELLKSIKDCSGIYPASPLLSIDDLRKHVEGVNPDLVILQNTTFANSAYASEIVRHTSCPVLLWTLREPVIDGGRLRLNSLTGAYSAGNIFRHTNVNFEYLFGGPDEENTRNIITAMVKAAKVKKTMRSLNVAAIGHTPQGFGFGRGLDSELLKNFGINLISIEARELISKAEKYNESDYAELLNEAKSKLIGLEKTPEENVNNFAKLYKAYSDFVKENNIGAIASRCWPDFFVEYGTPVCGVLGMLNENLTVASCEADLLGAVSMYIGSALTGQPVFFGDPVSLDESENTVTYWHCGTAACSLASNGKAEVGVHPNRKIGPTMEFGCKPCDRVTVFRIGREPDGSLRFFIAGGEALDKPKQFLGTSVVVKTDTDSRALVEMSVQDGWEPHYVVVYGDVCKELEILANMLELDFFVY